MMPEHQLPHQALHQSVLLREVVAALSPADDAIYLDATFGMAATAGHCSKRRPAR